MIHQQRPYICLDQISKRKHTHTRCQTRGGWVQNPTSTSSAMDLSLSHTHKDPKLKHKSFPYHDVNHYPSPLKPNLTKNPYDQAKQIIVINQIIKSKSFPTTKSSFVEQQNKTCINVAIQYEEQESLLLHFEIKEIYMVGEN